MTLFSGPDCGYVSVTFFQFFMIFSCLGAFILRAFGLNRCQKGGLKKRHKKEVKIGVRATREKTSVGLIAWRIWVVLGLWFESARATFSPLEISNAFPVPMLRQVWYAWCVDA